MDVPYIVGQALGALAVVLGFISFQMKSSGKLILLQAATSLVFTLHYLLIGATTAMALNLLAVIKNTCYYFKRAKKSKSLFLPIFFTALVIVTGILTWEGWHSLILTAGLTVLSLSLAFLDAQGMRYAMLVKSPLCLCYNVIAHSLGGIVYECAVLVSSIIAIFTTRAKKKSA